VLDLTGSSGAWQYDANVTNNLSPDVIYWFGTPAMVTETIHHQVGLTRQPDYFRPTIAMLMGPVWQALLT
jgi:hypothetical protein